MENKKIKARIWIYKKESNFIDLEFNSKEELQNITDEDLIQRIKDNITNMNTDILINTVHILDNEGEE